MLNNKIVIRVFKNKKLKSHLLIIRKIENEIIFNKKKKKLSNIKNSQFRVIFKKFRKIFHEFFFKKLFFK